MASIREQAFEDLLAKANVGLSAPDQFVRSYSWGIRPEDLNPLKRLFYPWEPPTGDLGDRYVSRVGAVGDGGSHIMNEVFVAFEIVYKGDGSTPVDQAVDAALVDIQKKVVGQTSARKYVKVGYVGTRMARAQEDFPYARATLVVLVTYICMENDPEAWD